MGLVDICNILNDIFKDINAFEENSFIEELIVIMEKYGGIVHRREPYSWDAQLPQISRVRSGRENLRSDIHTVLLERHLQCRIPRVILSNAGHSLVSKFLQELQMNILASLIKPPS